MWFSLQTLSEKRLQQLLVEGTSIARDIEVWNHELIDWPYICPDRVCGPNRLLLVAIRSSLGLSKYRLFSDSAI